MLEVAARGDPEIQRADWTTVLKLVGALVFTIATWAGSAGEQRRGPVRPVGLGLGSRTLLRAVLVGAVLAVGSWYPF